MFAAAHLYLITLVLFSRFNLTIAVTKYLKQRTYSHNPAVQALHHCFSAISLIPFDGSFCLDRIRPGDVYSAMFRLRSCAIIVFSVVEKPTATTPFLSPMQNVVILHKDMWPRVKVLARHYVNTILLRSYAVELHESSDLEGGW